MYLDLDPVRMPGASLRSPPAPDWTVPDWTVIIPFFNERDYLAATIASLAAQSTPLTLVLVDNGSTDGSARIAERACRDHNLACELLTETRPGKVAALQAGLRAVGTRWVATCDADTIYPPHYLAAAEAILARPGCAIAGAYFVAPETDSSRRLATARTFLAAARLLPRQCHAGGAGQAFCTRTLRAAGGFDPARWNYVLEDHEVIHRVMRRGTMGYSADLWCAPSPRERDRASIRWTLFERLLYSAAAPKAGDWFFYSFLGARLNRRRLLSNRMRERQFHHLEGPLLAPAHPVL